MPGDDWTEHLPEAVDGEPRVDFTDPSLFLNRELSELAFQERVLEEARDDRNPLFERVRFLSILTRNLDEFFMKRVGGLKQQMEAGITDRTADGRTPAEQWEEVLARSRPMFEAQVECWETIATELAANGITVLEDASQLDAAERAALRSYLEENVLPTLTPLAFDPAHPFPFISNRSLSLAVLTEDPDETERTFTRVKIPQNRPRLVELEDDRYIPLEEVIRANLDLLFPTVEVVETALFRLTRNAEIRRNEEVAEDLINMIEEVIEQRRFATAVRLEVSDDAPAPIVDLLTEQLGLDEREVFHRAGLLDYRPLETLTDLDRPALEGPDWTPQPHPRIERASTRVVPEAEEPTTRSIFEEIASGDVLLHHPYHSFEQTFQRFLDAAARDPDVVTIKAAIYRTASDSKVIEALIEAAENGKQVAVMVELKARFDEENNLDWVRTLEEEGIHVAYGTLGLKTHTKTALVVRDESNADTRREEADAGVTLYSHIGTGNYHSETAKGYVDLGLLTADPAIGNDLVKLFNFFTGPVLDESFDKLLIAPVTMRAEFTDRIRTEAANARAGRPARIVVKLNGLEDPGIIAELYRASMAGVEIDLLVRDICRLRPGVEGLSETIRVHSIVGPFLEHSRIYHFANGGDPEWFLGSADWMTRNLDSRVEAVTPVETTAIREQLRFVLEVMLADNRRRWVMQEDGSYEQCQPGEDPVVDTQAVLMDLTLAAVESDGSGRGVVPEHPAVEPSLRIRPRATDAEAVDERSDDEQPPEQQTDGGTSLARPSATSPGDTTAPLARFPERWYVPDSERYAYAVRTPAGERRYFESEAGANAALRALYGG